MPLAIEGVVVEIDGKKVFLEVEKRGIFSKIKSVLGC